MSAKLIQLSIAIGLVAAPHQAQATAAELPNARLPNGATEFRTAMMAWEPAEPLAPAVAPVRQARAPAPAEAAKPERLPRLSSRFGYRGDPINGRQRMHSGIDIPGPLGTPIQASAGGFVRFAGTAGGYGRMVEIAHGDGLTTRYAHLSRILVRPGTPVDRGETIALMGSTGRSTGSHLHFEVRRGGVPANPLGYLGGASRPAFAPQSFGAIALTPLEPHISRFARLRSQKEPSDGLPSGASF